MQMSAMQVKLDISLLDILHSGHVKGCEQEKKQSQEGK